VVVGSFVVGTGDVDLVVVVDVFVVDVVFFSVVDFLVGSSSILKKSRSSRKGRVFSAVVVVEGILDVVVVGSDEDSFAVVEFINWSIANHVNSWFLSGVVEGFSDLMSYSSGLIDMDSNDTTEPLPRMIEGCLIGSCISKLSIKILLSLESTVLLF